MHRYLKPFLLLALLICAATDTGAQLRYGFRFGGTFAKASLSLSDRLEGASPNKNLNDRLSNRSGFSGGLALEYQFPKCGFAPDIALLYTRYNMRAESPAGDGMKSCGRNFLEVPIHLKYKFWIAKTHNLFAPMVYTGPSLMFRLGAPSDPPLDTKVFQPGWDAGIGFDIINFIQVTAGYRFGLGNAAGKDSSNYILHTNGWNVAATILFDF